MIGRNYVTERTYTLHSTQPNKGQRNVNECTLLRIHGRARESSYGMAYGLYNCLKLHVPRVPTKSRGVREASNSYAIHLVYCTRSYVKPSDIPPAFSLSLCGLRFNYVKFNFYSQCTRVECSVDKLIYI